MKKRPGRGINRMSKTVDAFCARCGEKVRAWTVVVKLGLVRLAAAVVPALLIGCVAGQYIARWVHHGEVAALRVRVAELSNAWAESRTAGDHLQARLREMSAELAQEREQHGTELGHFYTELRNEPPLEEGTPP